MERTDSGKPSTWARQLPRADGNSRKAECAFIEAGLERFERLRSVGGLQGNQGEGGDGFAVRGFEGSGHGEGWQACAGLNLQAGGGVEFDDAGRITLR